MTISRDRLPGAQSPLIGRMNRTHHVSKKSGVCNGVAYEGMLGILSEKLDAFDDNIEAVYKTDATNFTETGIKSPISNRITALFDGIALFQNGEDSLDFPKSNLSQDAAADLLLPLLQTQEITDAGGLFEIKFAVGLGTSATIKKYLKTFANIVDKNGLTKPIAFIIDNVDHAITLGYLPTNKQWVLIDANNLPCEYVNKDTNNLGKMVSDGLMFSSGNCVFALRAFVQGNVKNEYRKCIQAWVKTDSWKQVHKVTKQNGNAKNDADTSWLYTACKYDKFDLCERLLANGADVNAVRNRKDKSSPLYAAIINRNIGMIRLLLKAGADVNYQNADGATGLFLAAQTGQAEIVKILLENGADPELTLSQSEEKYLKFAKNKSPEIQEKVTQFLKKYREDTINKENGSLIGRLKWSLFNTCCSDAKRAFSFTHNYQMTPLQIAEIMGNHEVAKVVGDHLSHHDDFMQVQNICNRR